MAYGLKIKSILGWVVCSAALTGPSLEAQMQLDAASTNGIARPDLRSESQAGIWENCVGEGFPLDAHYTHWSCAGINKPNLGLNGVTGLLGLTFFF